ncbi:hypothetical protein ABT381_26625 [Streptomyces sp. NPDC000151]|uniref:hypothetical protein n=1 Tax=Streptomyces sp. NPDC000151 TaxID=3154244 RepID=UPI003316C033
MNAPVRLAALAQRGDVIGWAGRWHTVEHVRTVRLATGGLAIVLTWKDGGSARMTAGEMLLLGDRPT